MYLFFSGLLWFDIICSDPDAWVRVQSCCCGIPERVAVVAPHGLHDVVATACPRCRLPAPNPIKLVISLEKKNNVPAKAQAEKSSTACATRSQSGLEKDQNFFADRPLNKTLTKHLTRSGTLTTSISDANKIGGSDWLILKNCKTYILFLQN